MEITPGRWCRMEITPNQICPGQVSFGQKATHKCVGWEVAPNVANLLAWPTTSGSDSGGQHPNGRASEGWRPIMHDGLGQCPIKCDTGQRPIKRRRVNARIRLAIILFCLPHRWDTTSGAGSSGSDSISGHKFSKPGVSPQAR